MIHDQNLLIIQDDEHADPLALQIRLLLCWLTCRHRVPVQVPVPAGHQQVQMSDT